MSDSHGVHNNIPVPGGDVFIHAGDFTGGGSEQEVKSFADFVRRLPHKHKIVIAGNHDVSFERDKENALKWLGDSCIYLENEGVEIDGINFWGSPIHPHFDDTMTWVFGVRWPAITKVWEKIPTNTDVLITHGPPHGILDKMAEGSNRPGCESLRSEITGRVKPKIHVFGHIHQSGGIEKIGETLFINAAVLDEGYRLRTGCTVVNI